MQPIKATRRIGVRQEWVSYIKKMQPIKANIYVY